MVVKKCRKSDAYIRCQSGLWNTFSSVQLLPTPKRGHPNGQRYWIPHRLQIDTWLKMTTVWLRSRRSWLKSSATIAKGLKLSHGLNTGQSWLTESTLKPGQSHLHFGYNCTTSIYYLHQSTGVFKPSKSRIPPADVFAIFIGIAIGFTHVSQDLSAFIVFAFSFTYQMTQPAKFMLIVLRLTVSSTGVLPFFLMIALPICSYLHIFLIQRLILSSLPKRSFEAGTATSFNRLIGSARRMLQFEQQRVQKGGKEEGDRLIKQLIGKCILHGVYFFTGLWYSIYVWRDSIYGSLLWSFTTSGGKQELWIVMPMYFRYVVLHLLPADILNTVQILGINLFSVPPSEMCDERSASKLSAKFNSAKRNGLSAENLIHMAQLQNMVLNHPRTLMLLPFTCQNPRVH